MKKYIKKPLVIEAVQWDGKDNTLALLKQNGLSDYRVGWFPGNGNEYELGIDTLEGVMTACIGDYIIKGIKGEFYPCKEDVFKASYEAVQE